MQRNLAWTATGERYQNPSAKAINNFRFEALNELSL
jgi:hypothetical protein